MIRHTPPAYIGAALVFVILFLTLTHHRSSPTPAAGIENADNFRDYQKTNKMPTAEWTGPLDIDFDMSSPEPTHGDAPKERPQQTSDHEQTSNYVQSSSPEEAIGKLIRDADSTFQSLLSSQAKNPEEAAAAYRRRRGRHPPPGFDLWFKYAQENDAVIVEEFWDQVYHDLEPFWALKPAQIRAQARALGMAVSIKNGHTEINTDGFRHVIWRKMIEEVAHMLPDMVIPVNAMDEPRMMTPWEDITKYISTAHAEKQTPEASKVRRTIQGWAEDGKESVEIPEVQWHVVPPYSFAREACSPTSPISKDSELYNSDTIPTDIHTSYDTTHPFVENATLGSDTCHDPAIAAFHGALISPLSGKTAQVLQPLFGGSKLAVNNDILLPAPMYWNGEERFEMDDTTPWSEKIDTVIWRGTATGGRHNALNWPHFHRHRFVSLANGTKYANSDPTHDRIFTPAQRHAAIEPLSASITKTLDRWLTRRNDVAFTDLFCDNIPKQWGTCWYTDSEFHVVPGMTLAQQYQHKYLADIDGNSFSGRYRSFLYSNSVPLKATLYREWHDSRLIAWKHFVPMNNRFTDYYALLAYFMGCERDICGSETIKGHDAEAQAIAEAGAVWAKKVLRKVDMQIYAARVLLEYGRITDDNRALVGWVDDLLSNAGSSKEQGSYVADPSD